MQSTDFRDLIGANTVAEPRRKLAKGGHAAADPHKKPHSLTVVIAVPPPQPPVNPVMGALVHAMILHHLAQQQARRR